MMNHKQNHTSWSSNYQYLTFKQQQLLELRRFETQLRKQESWKQVHQHELEQQHTHQQHDPLISDHDTLSRLNYPSSPPPLIHVPQSAFQ